MNTKIMTISNLLGQAQDQLDLIENELDLLEKELDILQPKKILQPIMFFTKDAPLMEMAQSYDRTWSYDRAWTEINSWLNSKIGKELTIEPAIIITGKLTQAEYMQTGAMRSIYKEMWTRNLIGIADHNVIYDCLVWAPRDDIGPTGVYGSDVWGVPPHL